MVRMVVGHEEVKVNMASLTVGGFIDEVKDRCGTTTCRVLDTGM